MSTLKDAVEHLNETSTPFSSLAVLVGLSGAILELEGDFPPAVEALIDRAQELSEEFIGKFPEDLFHA